MSKNFGSVFLIGLLVMSMMPLALADDATDSTQGYGQNTREKARERVEDAQARMREARAQYMDVRATYLQERAKFMELKSQFLSCNGEETAECKEKMDKLKSVVSPYLLNASDLIIKELEDVKIRIQASDDLTESEKSRMISELDAKITDVNAAREKIMNIDADTTRQDINDAARTLRSTWIDVRSTLKLHSERLAVGKLGNIIEKTEHLSDRLEALSERLEARGKDTAVLEEKLADFNEKVDLARQKYDEALALLKDAKPGNMEEAVKDAHQLFTESKAALKDARALLRDIVSEIKAQNQNSLDVEQ